MNLDGLILNEFSRKKINEFAKKPVGALLLTGLNGVGLGSIAKALAREIAQRNTYLLEPTLHDRQKTRNINVEDLRKVVELAKVSRKEPFVIIIDEAEKISEVAWQPLLKIIEEPTRNLFFVLTTHNLSRIPATILSRAQQIEILPIKIADDFFEINSPVKITAQKLAQIKFLASNLPAEATRLASDEEYFREKSSKMSAAREFLVGDVAKRLEFTANISNRSEARIFIENIAKMLQLTASQKSEYFAKNIALVSEAIENIAANSNVKATLLSLSINLK